MLTFVEHLHTGDLVACDRTHGTKYPVLSVSRHSHDDSDVVRVDLGAGGVHFWWATSRVLANPKRGCDGFSFPRPFDRRLA